MIHYVYKHFDPMTSELVYIGHGHKGRAWQCGQAGTTMRGKEHSQWIDTLLSGGLTPEQFTEVIVRGLSKTAAAEVERGLIASHNPRFNFVQGITLLRTTKEDFEKAVILRGMGMFYKDIAQELGLSVSALHRQLNGKSRAMEAVLAQ